MPKEKKEQIEEQNIEVEEVSSEAPTEQAVEESAEPASEPIDDEVVLESDNQDSPADDAVQVASDDPNKTVTVQSLQFASFDEASQVQGESNKNLDILMDIKLQLTVELGRTELPIKKVLELTRGSIIELEKVAGEPVELYANGKLVAHGEVVVIEDNFGLRITSITEPDEILKSAG